MITMMTMMTMIVSDTCLLSGQGQLKVRSRSNKGQVMSRSTEGQVRVN